MAALSPRIRVALLLAVLALWVRFPTPSEVSASQRHIAFGAYAQPTATGSAQSALAGLERSIGRDFSVARAYYLWDSTFPDSYATWLRGTGHTAYLSVKARRISGRYVLFRDIATAAPGSGLYDDILRWAHAIRSYGVRVYFTFNHEPETTISRPSGGPADYVAAWRKVRSIFQREGVTNVTYAWTMADTAFSVGPSDPRYAPSYYPGDTEVDVMAAAGFNMYCRLRSGPMYHEWHSLEQIIEPFRRFARHHATKKLWLAEWGTPENPRDPTAKARWIDSAAGLFSRSGYEQFAGLIYWSADSQAFDQCTFRVNSSAASLAAFRHMGASSPYR